MAVYLRCTVTHRSIGPCFLRNKDAEAALGSSELLRITSDWASAKAEFPRTRGLVRRPVFHRGWQTIYAPTEVNRLVEQFHAAIASGSPPPTI